MSKVLDPVRLSKTMAFLLRHRPEVGSLQPDENGWVEVDCLRTAVCKILHRDVTVDHIHGVCTTKVRRFEIKGTRIRAVKERSSRPRLYVPDILYHATTKSALAKYHKAKVVSHGDRRQLYLSLDEAQAWRVAHRIPGGEPEILYIDTSRARRHGTRFSKNRRNGLFVADRVSTQDVLNMQPNFAEQLSAGGLPVRTYRGQLQVALIRVTRRSGVTWEVAKGKLEPGEPPETAAVREVIEEMGIQGTLTISGYVGMIRYGFLAPGGLPRLKTVYLYLMDHEGDEDQVFTPAKGEGIGDVRWFGVDDACRAVTHSSLRPIMNHARGMLLTRAGQLAR